MCCPPPLKPPLVALIISVTLMACPRSNSNGNSSRSNESRAKPEIGTVILLPEGQHVRVKVEVVRSALDRARGLMYRKELPADNGMLFIFDREEDQSFWMKNTYIPLDMIFINTAMKVVGVIDDTEPMTTESRSVGKPSRYVLEVNAGFAKAKRIGPGTRVKFDLE